MVRRRTLSSSVRANLSLDERSQLGIGTWHGNALSASHLTSDTVMPDGLGKEGCTVFVNRLDDSHGLVPSWEKLLTTEVTQKALGVVVVERDEDEVSRLKWGGLVDWLVLNSSGYSTFEGSVTQLEDSNPSLLCR